MTSPLTRLTAPLLFALLATPAVARDWQVDPAASTLGFVGTQMGSDFEGEFQSWQADITFDPEALADARVEVTVDTSSAVTFNADRDGQIGSATWFDVASFPTATFVAEDFERAGGDEFVAQGTLTLKGVSEPVSLPFTLEIDGERAHVRGETTVVRTDFNVGTGDFASGSTIGLEVRITVDLQATAD